MVDVWNELGKALGRALKPLADLATGVWTAFGDAAGDLVKGFIGAARGLGESTRPIIEDLMPGVFDEATAALGEGSPPKEIKEAVDKMVKQLMTMIEKESKTEPKSLPTSVELATRQASLIAGVMGLYAVTHAVSMALDASHLFKEWGFKRAIMDMLFQLDMGKVVGPMIQAPIWSSIITPMRMRANEQYPYQVPGTGVLPYLRAKELIDDPTYRTSMKYQALDETWSSSMLANTWRYPDFSDLRTMIHRGVKTWDDAKSALKMSLLQADYLDVYKELVPSIPGVSDLVRFAVREAYPDAKTFEEHYAKMTSWIGKVGYSTYFADAFWTAHWVIPSPGQADDLLHRGLITEEAHTALYILNDIRPQDIPALRKLTWSLPGRIDARWMFRWGEIDVSGLRDLLVKGGLDPAHADKVAIATARNQFLTEINRQIMNIKADFAKGYSVEAGLKRDLEALGLRSEVVEYHVVDALSDRDRSMRDERLRMLKARYTRGAVTMAQVIAEAEEILVDEAVRRAWLEALPELREEAAVEETYTTDINRLVTNAKYDYVRGYVEKPELVSRLQLLGLPDQVVEYHVMDADEDRARKRSDERLDVIKDMWLKDVETDFSAIEGWVKEIIVDEEARTLWLNDVYFQKLKTVRVAIE